MWAAGGSIAKWAEMRYPIYHKKEGTAVEAIFYTVQSINGDYAGLRTDDGREHSITMFLLPEGTTLGSRLKLENFVWELVE